MVNILGVILCILAVLGTVLILFIYVDALKQRHQRQEYAIKLMEKLKLKVFLLKEDLTDFTIRNNLMHVHFFYDFTFNDCLASLQGVESKCTDAGLLSTLKTSKSEKKINSIISRCKYWMSHVDRISYSLDNKSGNPVYNKKLRHVA